MITIITKVSLIFFPLLAGDGYNNFDVNNRVQVDAGVQTVVPSWVQTSGTWANAFASGLITVL